MRSLIFCVTSLLLWQCSGGYTIHNTTELLINMFLPSEEHTVITPDGYVLKMFRIPRDGATPVLFVHGFLGSSDVWILTNRKNNIPTIFYDQGYDVWITNQRGNTYSKRHLTMTSESSNDAFWNFSFHEIGLYDVSSSIDHILTTTGQDSLLYVGHSMAASALMVLCSQRPEYNSKIRAASLLAPVVFSMGESKVPVLNIAINQASFFAGLLYQVNVFEFLPQDETRVKITYNLCSARVSLCSTILKILFNTNVNNLVRDEIPNYLARLSSGTSVKNYEHLGNIVAPGRNFTRYDAGPERNLMMYGTPVPPSYDISRVTVPLALFYSTQDPFLDRYSISKLKVNAPNVIFDHLIPDPAFQHLDYLYGINAKPMVTNYLLKIFRDYRNVNDPQTSDLRSRPSRHKARSPSKLKSSFVSPFSFIPRFVLQPKTTG